MNIKSLPIRELTITGVSYAYQCGDDLVVDFEVRDNASYERYETAKTPETRRCSCCGKALRWVCIVEHVPTGTFHGIGRQCAATIDGLRNVEAAFAGASVALTQRAEAAKREAAFRAGASAEAIAALDWAKTGINKTAADIVEKIRRWGNPSDKQVSFLVGLHQRDLAYRATLTAGLTAGRQTLTGTVQSVKTQQDPYARRWGAVITKGVIALPSGCKVWGTVPAGTAAGTAVTFTATIELSERDPAFGFFKRPTKWASTNAH